MCRFLVPVHHLHLHRPSRCWVLSVGLPGLCLVWKAFLLLCTACHRYMLSPVCRWGSKDSPKFTKPRCRAGSENLTLLHTWFFMQPLNFNWSEDIYSVSCFCSVCMCTWVDVYKDTFVVCVCMHYMFTGAGQRTASAVCQALSFPLETGLELGFLSLPNSSASVLGSQL